MAIFLKKPVYLNEQGKRSNNEDSIYPQKGQASEKDDLFMVCDGVGGAQKGEVASKMVCIQFPIFFRQHQRGSISNKLLSRCLEHVEDKMTEYVSSHPECQGMATTLTFIYFNPINNRVAIAWSGDSRVYHIRKGEILYRTSDHSLVNELVRRGEITAEEARQHPQRNIILRAVSGSDSPTAVDTAFIDDVQEGDYFILCSDGILESIDDRGLPSLFSHEQIELQAAANTIKELCDNASRDNFSMYLLQVDRITPPHKELVDAEMSAATRDLHDTAELNPSNKPATSTESSSPDALGGSTRLGFMILSTLLGVLMIIGLMWAYKQYSQGQLCTQKKDTIRELIANKQTKEASELLSRIETKDVGCLSAEESSVFYSQIDELLREQSEAESNETASFDARNEIVPVYEARTYLIEDSLARFKEMHTESRLEDTLITEVEAHFKSLDTTRIMQLYRQQFDKGTSIEHTTKVDTNTYDSKPTTASDTLPTLPPSTPVDSVQ